MRIIAGQFKGRKINFPEEKNTRPLRDFVRESIFNIIENSSKLRFQIKDSIVLGSSPSDNYFSNLNLFDLLLFFFSTDKKNLINFMIL